jgi:hypothetical protein
MASFNKWTDRPSHRSYLRPGPTVSEEAELGDMSRRRSRALCAVVATASVLIGCGGTRTTSGTASRGEAESGASIARLALHLGAGSYAITASRTTLRGSATHGASVEVNGAFVPLHDGRWQRVLRPHVGRNRVLVEASMSGHAPVIHSIIVTRHRTPAEIEARARARREAELRAAAKREAQARTAEQQAAERTSESSSPCTNGTYVNSAGNTVCKPEESSTVPAGATAKCEDGTYSFSESRSGTCSHHGGVAAWLAE